MENIFVPYHLAIKLNELGFNGKCIATINSINAIHIKGTKRLPTGAMCTDELHVPTWEQAFNWFSDSNIDWPIETWIQPYLSDQPRQYEAFYWQRGITISIGKFNTKEKAKINLLTKICTVYEEMLRNIKA